jgi:hypothetical protein
VKRAPTSPPARRAVARAAARHAAMAACVALAACAAQQVVGPDQPKEVRDQPLTPYAIHEECVRMAAGDRIDYEFGATEPVDFNIHYHDANAVVAPVVREKSTADSGIFVPRIGQQYCLMWEAGPAGALLDYRVRLRTTGR